MKQFNNEQEKEVVYVQVKDIRFLVSHTNEPLPQMIYTYFKSTKDMEGSFYIRFDDIESVTFFKYASYIIDFEAAKQLTSELLAAMISSLIKLATAISDMSKEDHVNLKWLACRYERYMLAVSDLQKIQSAIDDGTIDQLAFPGIPA